jgi:hypothetical protein
MMRGEISKHWQIVASALFSVVLVAGAYLLARGIESPQVAEASAETALLQAIATRDSDGDGLPDWEETLYGTDSRIVDTFHLGMSDGEAVARGLIIPKAIANVPVATSSPASLGADGLPQAPASGTLTAAFAQSFFNLFIAAREANGGADLSEGQMSDLANQAVSQLTDIIAPVSDFKSARDLTVSGSGTEALKAFAIRAEAVLLKNTNDATTTELNYLKAAIIDGDTTAYGHIASIAKSYRGAAAGLAQIPVPQELASYYLDLINSLMRMGETAHDFTRADSDPLVAILALQQYEAIVTAFGTAFVHIDDLYAKAGISLPEGTPGASFVNMVATVKKNVVAKGDTQVQKGK